MKMVDGNNIQYNRIFLDECSDLSLKLQDEYYTYNNIISTFSLWDKIVHQFIKVVRKNKLTEFYQTCGLKQIVKHVSKRVPYWYTENYKLLSDGFAQNLFYLLKSAYRIHTLLDQTIYNLNPDFVKVQKDPFMLEIVFHSFYKNSIVSEYPFSFDCLSKDITIKDLSSLKEKLSSKIRFYFNNISDADYERIDSQYSNWMAFSRIYDTEFVDFLRRFYFHISIEEDEYAPNKCTEVTLTAVRKYIEKLYLLISSIKMGDEELSFLLSINAALTAQESSTALSENEIRETWEGLKNSVLLFEMHNNLFNTLCLAYKNPNIVISGTKKIVSIRDIFSDLLYSRVLGLSDILVQDIIGEQMGKVTEELVEPYLARIDMGIYTVDVADRLRDLGIKKFPYIYLIPLMKHFMEYLNSWFNSFLSSVVVNVQFRQFSDLELVNQFLKKIEVFTHSFFNKFMLQITQDSVLSLRISKLINKNKLVENEIHLLNVFVDAINTQSEILIQEFEPIYKSVQQIANGFYSDIVNNSNDYILEPLAAKQLDGEELELRLKKLLDLCQQIAVVLNLTRQKQSILAGFDNEER